MTEGNVIAFPGHDEDPHLILEDSKHEPLDSVLVLGLTPDGSLYAASSTKDAQEMVWLVETFKHHLLAGDYSE